MPVKSRSIKQSSAFYTPSKAARWRAVECALVLSRVLRWAPTCVVVPLLLQSTRKQALEAALVAMPPALGGCTARPGNLSSCSEH